jgi:hypothetical protein
LHDVVSVERIDRPAELPEFCKRIEQWSFCFLTSFVVLTIGDLGAAVLPRTLWLSSLLPWYPSMLMTMGQRSKSFRGFLGQIVGQIASRRRCPKRNAMDFPAVNSSQ